MRNNHSLICVTYYQRKSCQESLESSRKNRLTLHTPSARQSVQAALCPAWLFTFLLDGYYDIEMNRLIVCRVNEGPMLC